LDVVVLVEVGLDWSGNEGNDLSDVFSSLEVVTSFEVRVHSRDIVSDLRDMLEGVGGNSGGREVAGPGLKSDHIGGDVLAVLDVSWYVLDDGVDFLNSTDVVLESSLLEVRDGDLDHRLKALDISNAVLNVLEVLVLDKSIKKSLDQVDVVRGSSSNSVWKSSGLDWANSGGEDISNILSNLLEVGVGPLGRDVLNITHDFGFVLNNVWKDHLGEVNWVLEDFSPLLDLVDVFRAGFALSKNTWEVSDTLSK